MSDKKEKKPRLRFPEFTDDWMQLKVDDIANRFDNFRIPVTSSKRIPGKIPYYGANGIQDYVEGFTHNGEYILVAEDGANDLKNYPVHYVNGKIWVNNHAHVLQAKEGYSTKFLKFLFQRKNISSFLVGGGRAKLNADVMMKLYLTLPSTLEEQERIASLFFKIENFIALNQCNLEILRKIKKGFVQKLFPKKGATNPKLRFPGFNDDWEQRKVGELLVERNERARTSKEYPLMAFIANKGVAPKGERYDRSPLVKDAKNKLYKKTEIGDFIYSSNNLETGSIGLNKYGKACISPVYSIFKPTKIVDSDFLGQRLTRKDFINAMVKWRQGVVYGQWKIHESDFLKIKLLAPSLKEQRKIGAYLDFLDSLISLYLQKLEILQNIKKGLLQQMFV